MNQKEGVNPMDAPPGFLTVMMPPTGVSEQSPTTGIVFYKPATIEIPPSPIQSPLSEEKVDYSREDFDFGKEPPTPPDTSNFSHLAVEDVDVTSQVRADLLPARITSAEGKL